MPPASANEGRRRITERSRMRLGANPDGHGSRTVLPRHHKGLADSAGEAETFELTSRKTNRSRH